MGILTRAIERRSRASVAAISNELAAALWGPSQQSLAGVEVTHSSAIGQTAFYCAVKVISESVGQLPLNLLVRRSDGGADRSDSPLWRLLAKQPNGEQTSVEFREFMTAAACRRGVAYAEIDIDDRTGAVRGLWPLPPGAVEMIRKDGRLAYRYRSTIDHMEYIWPAYKVLRLPGFASEGLTGLDLVQAFRQSIGLGIALQEHGARFFGQGAKPQVALEYPGKLSPEARQNIERSWEQKFGGLSGKHRVAILQEGMKLKEFALTNESSQFLESRKFQLSEFARMLRVPPHLLMDLDKATFSNIEQQSTDFVVHTLQPWLRRWEQRLDMQLLTTRESERMYWKFNANAFLRGDTEARKNYYQVMLQNGVLSPDEVRQLEDMNPQPGGVGKVYYRPLNLGTAGAQRSAGIESRAVERRNAADRLALARRFRSDIGAAWRQVTTAERRAVLKILDSDISQALAAQKIRRWYRDNYAGIVGEQMTQPMTAAARAIADYVEQQETRVPVSDDELQRHVGETVAGIAAREADSSAGRLEAALTDGGAEAAREKLDHIAETKPDQIADRETVDLSNSVSALAYAVSGVAFFRVAAIGDNCPFCRKLDGRRHPVGQPMFRGGDEFEADGADHPLSFFHTVRWPPFHRGCDCQIVPA